MLFIWTSSPKSKVLNALAPVLQGVQGLQIEVGQSWEGIQPTVIFALGKEPLEFLADQKVVPKNRTITSLRGQPIQYAGAKLLLSYSAGVADNLYSHYIDLLCDFGIAARLALTGKMEPEYGNYRYVPDFSEFIAHVEAEYEKTQQPVKCALDLETIGVDEFALPGINPDTKLPDASHPGAYIVTIQLSHTEGMADVVKFDSRQHEEKMLSDFDFAYQVAWLLSTPKIKMRGANLKFDLRWLFARGGFECTNFRLDTTLVGSILDENRSNGLDVHAKIYVPRLAGYSDVFDRTANKARMDLELLKDPKGFLNYSGGDPDATLSVANQQEIELLKDPYLTRFYVNILHPAARAFEKVESGGILVDTEAFRELHADLQAESIRLVTEAKKILGGRIVAKHADETKPGGMNITKASLIKDYMFSPMGLNLTPQMVTEKTKEPSSSLDHLLMFKDVPEASAFVQLMGDYASCTKTQSTFVEGFLEHLRSDGRFHPSFWFFAGNKDEGEGGTNTGRLSCKGPAFQCMVGSTPVLTRKGYVRIDKIVSDEGIGHEVLTHTGNWRRVVGVYRNGVRPVFRVKLSSGHAIDCTGNHPVLTRRGWVKTEDLKIHDVCYHTRTPNPGEHVSDVLQLGSNEESLPVVHFEGLGELRRSRDNSLRTLAEVREFSGGHGGEARRRVVDRAGERERELRAWELQVGTKDRATEQSSKHEADHLERSNSVRGPVGESVRDHEGQPALSPIHWGDDAVCLETFQECEVVSIEALGQEETFDLTIDSCHSFVANGVVVHNTLPKHTKWAKRLRKCYIAPDGYVVMERDYSQGELKIVACVANETNMIEAYRNGMDLHALTSGRFAGYDYEAMMKLKKEDEATYDAIRQLGKAGNFGLLYGMGADGFWAYAVDNYGVKNFSLQDAAVFRTGFFEMYPALVTYHNTYKAMAKRDGKIYSPLGRVRHLPMINSSNRMERSKAERQAINSPIQATLSDLLLWTAAEEHAMGLSKLCPMFGACHDAAYSYVPEDRIDELVPQMLHVMENLPLEKVGWKPQLNFTADAKIGVNMAEMKKYVPV